MTTTSAPQNNYLFSLKKTQKPPKKWECHYQTWSEHKSVPNTIPGVREVSYLCEHPELRTSQWLLKEVNQRRVHQSGCSRALTKIVVVGIGILVVLAGCCGYRDFGECSQAPALLNTPRSYLFKAFLVLKYDWWLGMKTTPWSSDHSISG